MSSDNKECFEALANAIIAVAAKDYQYAYKLLDKNPNNRDAKILLNECLRFFRSKWYHTLTDIPSDVFIKRLETVPFNKRDHYLQTIKE